MSHKPFALVDKVQNWLKERIGMEFYDEYGTWLNTVKLANHLGIEVLKGPFPDSKISGSIVKEGDKFTIYINSDDSSMRQRFTLAHELGHFISNECGSFSASVFKSDSGFTDMKVMNRDRSKTDAELEANEIAGCLLMPEDSIKDFVSKCIEDGDIDDIGYRVGNKFGVSSSAAYVRLINLGIMSASALYEG